MTKSEFQKLTGKSPAQTRKLCDKGEFFVEGHGYFRAVKTGKGKTCPVDIYPVDSVQEHESPEGEITAGAKANNSLTQLKNAKIAVEIQALQQKLYERQADIEQNYGSDIIKSVIEALKPLKEAFRECKLTKEQVNLIDDAINESLMRVESLLSR